MLPGRKSFMLHRFALAGSRPVTTLPVNHDLIKTAKLVMTKKVYAETSCGNPPLHGYSAYGCRAKRGKDPKNFNTRIAREPRATSSANDPGLLCSHIEWPRAI